MSFVAQRVALRREVQCPPNPLSGNADHAIRLGEICLDWQGREEQGEENQTAQGSHLRLRLEGHEGVVVGHTAHACDKGAGAEESGTG